MRKLTYLALFVALLTMSANCHASKQKKTGGENIKTALGDSISNIICNSQNVVAFVVGYDSVGHIEYQEHARLNSLQRHLIRFIIDDDRLYETNQPLYGLFSPSVRYKFSYKKTCVYVDIDFGLTKWRICNSEGKALYTFDTPDHTFLRLAHSLFPKNEAITHFYETGIKK